MRRFLAPAVVLALLAGPALACLNDSELPSDEQEFRSDYTRAARQPARGLKAPAQWPLIAGGLAMVGSAAALTLLDGRARR